MNKKIGLSILSIGLFLFANSLSSEASVSIKNIELDSISYGDSKEYEKKVPSLISIDNGSNELGYEISVRNDSYLQNKDQIDLSLKLNNLSGSTKTKLNLNNSLLGTADFFINKNEYEGTVYSKLGENPKIGTVANELTWTLSPVIQDAYWGTAKYTLEDNGSTLVVRDGILEQRHGPNADYSKDSEILRDENAWGFVDNNITKIIIKENVELPEYSNSEFRGFHNLNEIVFEDKLYVGRTKEMKHTFADSEIGRLKLDSWNLSSLRKMDSAFRNSKFDNLSLNYWDIGGSSSQVDIVNNFKGVTARNIYMENWNTSFLADGSSSFTHSFDGAKVTGDLRLSDSNMSAFYDFSGLFAGSSINLIYTNNWNIENVTNMKGIFQNGDTSPIVMHNWDTRNVENMSFLVANNKSGYALNPSKLDTSKVKNFSYAFSGIQITPSFFTDLDVSGAWTLEGMFSNAKSLNGRFFKLGKWDVRNVVSIEGMFKNIPGSKVDLSHPVIEMRGMEFNRLGNMREFLSGTEAEISSGPFFNMEGFNVDSNLFDEALMGYKSTYVNFFSVSDYSRDVRINAPIDNAFDSYYPERILLPSELTYAPDIGVTGLWELKKDPTKVFTSPSNPTYPDWSELKTLVPPTSGEIYEFTLR